MKKLALFLLALQTSNVTFGFKEDNSLIKEILKGNCETLPENSFKKEPLSQKKLLVYSGITSLVTGTIAGSLTSDEKNRKIYRMAGTFSGAIFTYHFLKKYITLNKTKAINRKLNLLPTILTSNEQAQAFLERLSTTDVSKLSEAELFQNILAALNDTKNATTFTQKEFFAKASPAIHLLFENMQALQKRQLSALPEEEQPAETASERQRLSNALSADLALLTAVQNVLNNPFECQESVIDAQKERIKALENSQAGNKSLSQEHAKNIKRLQQGHEKALEEKSAALEKLTGTVLKLQQEHMSCGERLEGQKLQHENQLSVLKKERDTLNQSFNILHNEHKNCGNLNAQVQELTAQTVAMKQKVEASLADQEIKAVELNELNNKIQKLSQEQDAAHNTIQSLKENLANAEKELAGLPEGKSINDLRQALEQKERTNTRLTREISIQKEMYAKLTHDYNEAIEAKEKALAKEADALNRLNNLKAKL